MRNTVHYCNIISVYEQPQMQAVPQRLDVFGSRCFPNPLQYFRKYTVIGVLKWRCKCQLFCKPCPLCLDISFAGCPIFCIFGVFCFPRCTPSYLSGYFFFCTCRVYFSNLLLHLLQLFYSRIVLLVRRCRRSCSFILFFFGSIQSRSEPLLADDYFC